MADKIVVGESAIPTTLAATLRYVFVTAVTFAVGRGWVDAENVEGVVALLSAAATVAYGLWKTYSNRSKLTITAKAAPNDVAIVKS